MHHIHRVLVAEESALLRRMLSDVLRERGYEVLETGGGHAALEIARAQLPDVLLLARELPGLDGLAVLDALRIDPRTAEIPVVFVTGRTDASELAETLERGAHDYVRKPVDAVELIARVRSALRTSSLLKQLADRNADLELVARTDALTSLANRRHAEGRLRDAVDAARRDGGAVTAVLIDIDRFKSVNDRYGHASGDGVLCEVARRLAAGVGSRDLAARWGGEEFLLILPDVADADHACEELRRAVSDTPVPLAIGTSLKVSASFGWASLGTNEEAEELVARADAALYAAKDAGRDRVVGAAASIAVSG